MKNIFFEMLQILRLDESVILTGKMEMISASEENESVTFLRKEYEIETLNYPFEAPKFDAKAALWAAKLIYVSANLLLYREQKLSELSQTIVNYEHEIDPSAILSADLTLRFLPQLILNLELIDREDELIEILQNILANWPYSGMQLDTLDLNTNLEIIKSNKCLNQLFCNRIIQYKNINLAKNPLFSATINGNLGIYKKEFWPELNP